MPNLQSATKSELSPRSFFLLTTTDIIIDDLDGDIDDEKQEA